MGRQYYSKEKENEIPEFDRDLVSDPVLFVLWFVGTGIGHSRYYPRAAGPGRGHFYPEWQIKDLCLDDSLQVEAVSV